MTDDSVTVQLVNLDPVSSRRVVVQGGAYAEHELQRVTVGDQTVDVPGDGTHFTVELAPGAGQRLHIAQKRFARQPTFAFPWDR